MPAAAKQKPFESLGGAVQLPLTAIEKHPDNPRKHFSGLVELAEDIKKRGVIQPVLVRPKPAGTGTGFQLVAGERRYRASELAAIETIPALIRELSDDEALEIMYVENAKRADLHSLEEAQHFDLLKNRGMTEEQIASKVGKDLKTIKRRLKLLALTPAGKKAFEEGKLDIGKAQILAGISNAKLQDQALKEVVAGRFGEELTLRDVRHLVHSRFMLELKAAPFDRKDEKLCPAAGSCVTCPKRTGSQPELFDDADGPDICTDPPCYQAKVDAHWEKVKELAKADGKRILTEKQAEQTFNTYDGHLSYTAPYVELLDKCPEDPKRRTYKQLLGKTAADFVVVGRDPKHGKVHELVPREKLAEALEEAGCKVTVRETPTVRTGSSPSQKAEKKKQELKRSTARLAIRKIVEKVEKGLEVTELLHFVVERLLQHSFHEEACEIAKVRGWSDVSNKGHGNRAEDVIRKKLKDLDEAQLRGLVYELVITRGAYWQYQPGFGEGLKEAAKYWKLDLKKVANEVRAAEAAELKAKAAKKGKAA